MDELVRRLNAARVRYLLIGGQAMRPSCAASPPPANLALRDDAAAKVNDVVMDEFCGYPDRQAFVCARQARVDKSRLGNRPSLSRMA